MHKDYDNLISEDRVYLCIDLKSFYASVECAERGLDPFKVNLVVSDASRGKGAITLAITPKMKKYGIPSRVRLFQIDKNIKYEIAKPRMSLYIEYAANIYAIYLRYVSKEDIHVYSIDEAFIDVTKYLKLYQLSAYELAKKIMADILNELKITATCGIGTNLYLAKIALDILSKHNKQNIGYLNKARFYHRLSRHQPLTDFWQIGRGICKRLDKLGIYNMEDIRNFDPEILYKEFGVNAEYLIDHAFAYEPCLIKDIKNYHSKTNSFANSQILFEDYSYEDALTVLKEMVDLMSLKMIDNHLVCGHISLRVDYSKDSYKASATSHKLAIKTNVYTKIVEAFITLYHKEVRRDLPIRKISISCGNLKDENYEQLDLFTDFEQIEKERNIEKAMNSIKHKYGKNAVLRGLSYKEKATQRKRNKLIGGHNAE